MSHTTDPTPRLGVDQYTRRGFFGLLTGLGAGALVGCGTESKSVKTPDAINSQPEGGEPEIIPIEKRTLEDYRLRYEPFSGHPETAFSYAREQLLKAGSTPTICDPAHRLFDAIESGNGRFNNDTASELLPGLSTNLAHALNFILANYDGGEYFHFNNLLPLLQHVLGDIDSKRSAADTLFVEEFVKPFTDKYSANQRIKIVTSVELDDVNYRSSNGSGQETSLLVKGFLHGAPEDSLPITIDGYFPATAPMAVRSANPLEAYQKSLDFDKPAEVVFL